MKAFLLTAAVVLAAAGGMLAQNFTPEHNWEVGVNGGICAFTRPLGPSAQYTGTRTNTAPDVSVRVNHFFNEHWMLGINIGSRKWQAYGTWQQNAPFGQPAKSEQVSILVASHAITESFELNYIIPFYTKFETYNKANLYFGAMLGLVTTVNDGAIGYSKYKGTADSNSSYVSGYNYGFGIGYSLGVQVGYTYYIIPRLGVNVELAARYADVHTNDVRYSHANTDFYLLYFPETVGVRYRF